MRVFWYSGPPSRIEPDAEHLGPWVTARLKVAAFVLLPSKFAARSANTCKRRNPHQSARIVWTLPVCPANIRRKAFG